MDKKTITQIATAALITTAGITVTNNLKPLNITGSGNEVKAATTQTAQQFIDKAAPAAVNASSKYGTYTSVMMAQAAVESGWGNSTLSQEPNNNLFGIKGSYNGQSVAMKTGEYDSNGNYYTTTANFRKYPSYEESFNDNGSLLRSQMGDYYSGAWVENASSGKEATQNGLQGKYATAPSYSATLNNVIDTYNLQQYDPETTEVNETKTVTNTTPITDAPVDSDVANQVGTAREGQQLNITKYITYKNGVKHAYVGTGWVNNSAFAVDQPTTTDTSATQTTQATQPSTTSQTQTVQQPASQPAKPATTQVQATKAVQTTTAKTTQAVKKTTTTQTVKTPVVKASTTVKKTTVSQAPTKKVAAVAKTTASIPTKTVAKTTPKTTTATKTIQAVAKVTSTSTKTTTSTAKKVATTSQVQATPQVEQTAVTKKAATTAPVTATQTKAVEKTTSSKKATIQKADTVKSVVKEAEAATPVVDEKKNDVATATVAPKAAATVAVTKTTKKSAKSTTEPVKAVKTAVKLASTSVSKKIANVAKSVKPVTVKAATVAPKKATSKVKTATVSTSKANSKTEKLITKPIVETTTTKKVSAEASQIGSDYVIKSSGVLTINARPNYGVAIWSVPGKKRTSRYLQNGTSWKFFKIAMINGEKWYNLGGNQWVPAKAVMVR